MKPIVTSPENAPKLRDWLANRGGIAVWVNHDLGSPDVGGESFTPALTDGQPTQAPHWRFGATPDRVIVDASLVSLVSPVEVFRVKIRRGPPHNNGVHRADYPRVQKALAEAGPGAWFHPDHSNAKWGSPWFEAVICVDGPSMPLNPAA